LSLGGTTTARKQREVVREITSRPATSQNIGEKTAYFDELLSSKEVLKDLKMMSHIGKGAFSIVSMAVDR
jgi:hypothetical protein